jgi:mannose-6-phosphate isomerase-like protein (cupin superfamily)
MENTFYIDDASEFALENENFRRVMFTTDRSQLVLMALRPGEDIGSEVHAHVDQVFTFVEGTGEVVIVMVRRAIKPRTVVVVPAGARHNVVNTGTIPLKLVTVYSPPQHAPGTVHKTKAEAIAAEHVHHGE